MCGGDALLIVTNTTVAPLYAALRETLAPRFHRIHLLELPDGSSSTRTWATLNLIFDALLAPGVTTARRCCSRWAAAWWAV